MRVIKKILCNLCGIKDEKHTYGDIHFKLSRLLNMLNKERISHAKGTIIIWMDEISEKIKNK